MKESPQPFLCSKRSVKIPNAPLAELHPSRSSDLRIKETLAPSHEKNRSGRLYKANMSALHAYSGGTVRDFHPIPYSSAKCGHSDKIYNYI